MNWYYVDQGQQAGPVDDAQFEELAHTGKIQPDTLVWREGMAGWLPHREAAGGISQADPPPPTVPAASEATEAACAECGKIHPIQDMIRHGGIYICATCKPVFMQKLAEGARLNTGELRYAGFGIRFAAKLLDGLIIGVPYMIMFFMVLIPGAKSRPDQFSFLPLLMQCGIMALNMAYQIFFLGKYGATLGKMACKIKVVTADGNPIGYGRATGRAFAEMLSGIICYIGYIIAAFDNQRRTLHDHICNTRVVFK